MEISRLKKENEDLRKLQEECQSNLKEKENSKKKVRFIL